MEPSVIFVPEDEVKKRAIIGIDLGSSSSGSAWSVKTKDAAVTNKQYLNPDYPHTKVKTAVLFKFSNPENLTFHPASATFLGKRAVSTFYDAATSKKSGLSKLRSYYVLFQEFKMRLLDKHESPKVAGQCSWSEKEVYANFEDIAGAVLYLLATETRRQMNKFEEFTSSPLGIKDIQWVLTIPAMWNQVQISIMREAALRAGLVTPSDPMSSIKFSMEPEAAAIDINFRAKQASSTTSQIEVKENQKIMIIDAGGGTVDLTVYEFHGTLEEPRLKELEPAVAGNWGSLNINNEFKKWFGKTILGQGLWDQLSKSSKIALDENFNVVKESFACDSGLKLSDMATRKLGKLILQLPPMVDGNKIEIPGWRDQLKKNSSYSKKTVRAVQSSLRGSDYRLNSETLMKFFNVCMNPIIRNLRPILQKHKFDHIFITGGFSQSPIFQQKLREEFPQIIPYIRTTANPGLSVVSGAVRFGQVPERIHTRRAQCHYCIVISPQFQEGTDPEDLRQRLGAVSRIDKLVPLVHKHEEMPINHTVTREFNAISANQATACFRLKAVYTDSIPKYLNLQPGMQHPDIHDVGVLVVPQTTHHETNRAVLRMSVLFGNNEISLLVRNESTAKVTQKAIKFI